EDAGICHEKFETGHTFADKLRHLFDLRLRQVSDDAMECIIRNRLRSCLLHPGVERSSQRLAPVLNSEINQGRGAAECGSAGAGLEVVSAGSSAERHVEMRVHVDPAGHNVLALGVEP